MPEQNEQVSRRPGIMRSRPVLWLGLLLLGFLVGAYWQYKRAEAFEGELGNLRQAYETCERNESLAGIREAISLAHFEAMRMNYGLAREHATLFFDRLRELLGKDQDLRLKTNLEKLMPMRDRVEAGLVSGDPAVAAPLQELLLTTFEATKTQGRLADK